MGDVLLVAPNASDENIEEARFRPRSWMEGCNDFLKEVELVEEACRVARTTAVWKRRRGSDQDRKAARAESLVMVGELSFARQVLIGVR